MLLIYLFITLFCIIIIFYGYYKIKYKHWIKHPLNFNLFFKSNFFFDKSNIFLLENSNTFSSSFNSLSNLQKSYIKNFDSYFSDLDIVSLQNKKCSLIHHKTKSVFDDHIMSSFISSFQINGPSFWKGFYMNNIILDNLNNILLHHLFYYIFHLNINYGLFKHSILPFVTPLCVFNIYTFPVTKWRQPPAIFLNPKFKLIPLSKQNFHLFTNFLKSLNSDFHTILYANFERIMYLIYNSFWHANLLLFEEQVKAIFFFQIRRKSVLHCFASVNKCEKLNDFIYAFKMSFWNIANKNNCNLASIDSLSHNNPIIDNIIQKTHPSSVTPFAFYFYNFKKSTSVPNHDCLLVL